MKNIFFLFFLLSVFFSCNNYKKEYENNLNHFNSLIEEINSCFIDDTIEDGKISDYYTDDFVFHSYPAGHKKGIETSKDDYIEAFNQMKEMNMSIRVDHSIYLPGMDKKSYKIDGSVRVYYGAILYIDTNTIEYSGYQTINFYEGKISEIWEWTDYGGIKTQINEFISK